MKIKALYNSVKAEENLSTLSSNPVLIEPVRLTHLLKNPLLSVALTYTVLMPSSIRISVLKMSGSFIIHT